jgi:hypothetical protein
MKIGNRVTLVDAKGKSHAATVTDVAGTGASGYKTLDLAFDGGTAENVPHGRDSEKGEGFWLLETETETPPERRAPVDEQPIALAVAAEAGTLPESDRRSEEDTAPDARRKAVK